MRLSKNQVKNGYISATILLLVVASLTVLTFVVEVGRMIITSSQAENGVDLAANGGIYKYGKELKEKTKEEYSKAYSESVAEVDEDPETAVLTPEEREEKIKQKTKDKLEGKAADIKKQARSSCNSKIKEIATENSIIFLNGECTDSEVAVTGKKAYLPALPGLKIGSIDMVRNVKRQIVILSN